MNKLSTFTSNLLLILVFLIFSSRLSLAGEFMGHYCIQMQADSASFRAFELAMTEVTPGYFQLDGKFNFPNGSGMSGVTGSAFSDENDNLTATLRESHADSTGVSKSTYHFQLAPQQDTLSTGSFRQLLQTAGQSAPATIAGTASFDLCSNEPPDLTQLDNDNDGYTIAEGDCNDSDPDYHPTAVEICGDGLDQDCDGEDLVCPPLDNDGDGYSVDEDCDDNNAAINPGAHDHPFDSIDLDCDPTTYPVSGQ
jgi:hypothetical protein